jgi:hypothetical protein
MNERDLFIGALQRPEPTQREAYLEQECAGDAALRRRVEVLLGAHAEAGGILKAPWLLVDPTDQNGPAPADRRDEVSLQPRPPLDSAVHRRVRHLLVRRPASPAPRRATGRSA